MSTDVAIVTGYASGLGRAFAEDLLGRGWAVVGVRRAADPPAWAAAHGALHHVAGSVAADQTVAAALAAARAAGRLRLVINCAGQGVFGEVGTYDAAQVAAALEGNLTGVILFTDAAVPVLAQTGGDIVNVMSTAGKKLRPAESVYTAAKWGAKAYTRTVRDAVKARGLPIRVVEVYPCGMRTPFWDAAVRPVADGAAYPPPEPIARAVLASLLDGSPEVYQQEFTFERPPAGRG